MSVLASHIYILGYLLGRPPSKANLLVLLFLFLKVLLLCFLPLLGLFGVLGYLPPMALTMLRLGFLLPGSASVPSTPMRLSSVGLTSVVLRWMVSQYSSVLCFGSSLFCCLCWPLARLLSSSIWAWGEPYIKSSK